jgi:hypothetical protein
MNERIKQLAVQASKDASDGYPVTLEYTNRFAEKFAELIVRECMRMCDVAAVGYETHGHTKEANGCYSAKEYIEEHFGVEE